jgi:MoxR-like ATPase
VSDTRIITSVYEKILSEVNRVVIGKDGIKEALVLSLIAGGHLLIEGHAGSAKTKLAKSFAEAVGGVFKRIQFTPDMMPADITGFNMYSPSGSHKFVEGPIFSNIVLADELNRTTPRTQSALLEAMQEYQVTIEGKTYLLERPFIVIATQVRSGSDGTYPLTDVQVDRFMLKVPSEYPSRDEEKKVLGNIDQIDVPDIHPVATLLEILEIQAIAKSVYVSEAVVDYTIAIVERARGDADVQSGPSTRGSIALHKCARVLALLDGRDYVIPDDIKRLVMPALEHRIRVRPEAEMDEVTPRSVLEKVLSQVPVPKPEL